MDEAYAHCHRRAARACRETQQAVDGTTSPEALSCNSRSAFESRRSRFLHESSPLSRRMQRSTAVYRRSAKSDSPAQRRDSTYDQQYLLQCAVARVCVETED